MIMQHPSLSHQMINVLLLCGILKSDWMMGIMSFLFPGRMLVQLCHTTCTKLYLDRDARMYLWRNAAAAVVHYRMKTHLFGGVWCASSAAYALRRVVADNPCDPLIAHVVRQCFYVDDCLTSASTKDDFKRIIYGTRELLSKCGFNITKFVVNDIEMLKELVPLSHPAKKKSRIYNLLQTAKPSELNGVSHQTLSISTTSSQLTVRPQSVNY